MSSSHIMLITTMRRHLCLIFLKTAGAILLFHVARGNWPATRTKTYNKHISGENNQIQIENFADLTNKGRRKKISKSNSFLLPAWVATWRVMPQPHELHTWSCWKINIYKGLRNLSVLWDIWDIWWLRTECLTMVARKYSQYWISIRQNRYKSTHPPQVGRLQHAV